MSILDSLTQTTPKSASKKELATLGKKRPREEENSSSADEEELDTSLLSAQQVKKLKQMIAEDGDHSDAESEEGDSDVDQDDDEDDDSDDLEGDSEDDEGDSDDDESVDDEDDESEHDGDTEEEFPEKVVKANAKKDKKANATQQEKPKKQANAKKAGKPEKKEAPAPLAPYKVSPANVLLFNFPRLNEEELRGFLTKRGVQPESVARVSAPVAIIGLPSEAAAKKTVSACSGSAYSMRTLAAISVTGDDIGKIQTNKNMNPANPDAPMTCVLVTFIPKSVTQEQLLKMIDIKPKSMHLITGGAKNRITNACYIDCANEADAKEVYSKLQGREVDNHRFKVFLKQQQNYSPITDTSFVVTNVPFAAGVEEMQKEFPTATKIDLTRKGSFLLHFATSAARNKAAESAKTKTMEGRPLRIVTAERTNTDFSIFIANLPFDVKNGEVREIFPKSTRVHLQLGKNGKCNG